MAEALAQSGCAENARLVIEKPFGHNRATARALSRLLAKFFPEENIFRIDHYLGKEPVQNIVYTRFANSMFEPIWNRDHVRSIQITMAENFGVQDRGHFYDETGAIRDVVQNHMLQVLAQLTMDPPTGEEHEAMRDQKAALLKAVRPLDPAHVVRGQYAGYQAVPGVRAGSTVETFVAVKLFIDTWRWAGVPIYIRAGKELPVTATEVVVQFKRPPRETFDELVPLSSGHVRMRISPDVSIAMGVRVKLPGERMVGEDVELILTEQAPTMLPPYQRLLGDAMHGIGELFGRDDIVDAQWRIVEPILDNVTPVYPLRAGHLGSRRSRGADRRRRTVARSASRRRRCQNDARPRHSVRRRQHAAQQRPRAGRSRRAHEHRARRQPRAIVTGRSSRSCAANSATPIISAHWNAIGWRRCTIPGCCGCRTGWWTTRSPTGCIPVRSTR